MGLNLQSQLLYHTIGNRRWADRAEPQPWPFWPAHRIGTAASRSPLPVLHHLVAATLLEEASLDCTAVHSFSDRRCHASPPLLRPRIALHFPSTCVAAYFFRFCPGPSTWASFPAPPTQLLPFHSLNMKNHKGVRPAMTTLLGPRCFTFRTAVLVSLPTIIVPSALASHCNPSGPVELLPFLLSTPWNNNRHRPPIN